MSAPLRYRLADEPRAGLFGRIVLPPVLVFMAATFFMPWGLLLIALNALALGAPTRWREIALVAAALAVYFGADFLFLQLNRGGILPLRPATYLFFLAIGGALTLAAFAFISQARTAALRRYLAQRG